MQELKKPTPFVPQKLPLEFKDSEYKACTPVLIEANKALARYDVLLQNIPNPAILHAPLQINEAVLSSRMEGTQASIDDVYESEAGIIHNEEMKRDIGEILNYSMAVKLAELELETRSLSLHIIRGVHGILLQGVRGKSKTPGSFPHNSKRYTKHRFRFFAS